MVRRQVWTQLSHVPPIVLNYLTDLWPDNNSLCTQACQHIWYLHPRKHSLLLMIAAIGRDSVYKSRWEIPSRCPDSPSLLLGSLLILPHPSCLSGEESWLLSLHVFQVHELKISQTSYCSFSYHLWTQEGCLLSCRKSEVGDAKKANSVPSLSQMHCIPGETSQGWLCISGGRWEDAICGPSINIPDALRWTWGQASCLFTQYLPPPRLAVVTWLCCSTMEMPSLEGLWLVLCPSQ